MSIEFTMLVFLGERNNEKSAFLKTELLKQLLVVSWPFQILKYLHSSSFIKETLELIVLK